MTTKRCTYLKRDGPCLKMSYTGRCHAHRTSTSHIPCAAECGRNTLSWTGFCNKCGPGKNGHQEVARSTLRKRQIRWQAEMDAYLEELIG